MARRSLHDAYFKQAKRDGYVARSAYKLIEIHERFKVFRPGQRVLDLGCAPGSWLQVVEPLVGPRGRVVGIDLSRTTIAPCPHVHTIEGDAFEQPPETLIEHAGGRFHVVLSDMAPKTSGAGDDLVSAEMCRQVLELAPQVGGRSSALVMKILEGAAYPEVLKETRMHYREVKGFRPKATRDVSREIFIVARGLLGGLS